MAAMTTGIRKYQCFFMNEVRWEGEGGGATKKPGANSVVSETQAGLDFVQGGGADALDLEQVVRLGEGAGVDDALGDLGSDIREIAEFLQGGGVDVDGRGGGVFTQVSDGDRNRSEGDEADPEPAHLAVACPRLFQAFFDEVIEGLAHGFD